MLYWYCRVLILIGRSCSAKSKVLQKSKCITSIQLPLLITFAISSKMNINQIYCTHENLKSNTHVLMGFETAMVTTCPNLMRMFLILWLSSHILQSIAVGWKLSTFSFFYSSSSATKNTIVIHTVLLIFLLCYVSCCGILFKLNQKIHKL